jgi:hypothetical protein
VAGETESNQRSGDFGGSEVAAMLPGDHLADLFDGEGPAVDDHALASGGFGLDALHGFLYVALEEVEGEAGDDTTHEVSQG